MYSEGAGVSASARGVTRWNVLEKLWMVERWRSNAFSDGSDGTVRTHVGGWMIARCLVGCFSFLFFSFVNRGVCFGLLRDGGATRVQAAVYHTLVRADNDRGRLKRGVRVEPVPQGWVGRVSRGPLLLLGEERWRTAVVTTSRVGCASTRRLRELPRVCFVCF